MVLGGGPSLHPSGLRRRGEGRWCRGGLRLEVGIGQRGCVSGGPLKLCLGRREHRCGCGVEVAGSEVGASEVGASTV